MTWKKNIQQPSPWYTVSGKKGGNDVLLNLSLNIHKTYSNSKYYFFLRLDRQKCVYVTLFFGYATEFNQKPADSLSCVTTS